MKTAFFGSWLMAWLFWFGLSLGALILLMIPTLTGGAWARAIREPCRAAVLNVPLLALLFAPIPFGAATLYPWMNRALFIAHDWPHKAAWFTLPFFTVRALGIFIVLSIFAVVLRRPQPNRVASATGLISIFLLITVAATDWIMSFTPELSSTIFPTILLASEFVSALAFMTFITCRTAPAQDSKIFHDLGNLLLAFTVFWAYVAFSQLLLVWSGNLPREIPWYLARWSGGWKVVGILLFLGAFLLPFALLLSKRRKQRPRSLERIAALVLVTQLLNIVWLVAPSLPPASLAMAWMLPMNLALIGAPWIFVFDRAWARPLLPAHG